MFSQSFLLKTKTTKIVVVLISAARDVREVDFSTRDFLINDCITVKMSVEGDNFIQKPPRAVEMSTTSY